jgi:hypothetical protein
MADGDRPTGEEDLEHADESLVIPTDEQLRLAYRAYEALHSAVVEQDEKTARFLTADAFFLAAATAVLAIDRVRSTTIEFPHGPMIHLPLLFLAVFLMALLLSATYLILSTGPQESWDTFYRPDPSFLSYMEVAESPPERLPDLLANRDDIRRRHYEWNSLVDSCRDQARRAEYKQSRLMEARAAFFLGIAPLIVALVISVDALAAKSAQLTWNWGIACPTAAALAVVTFLAIQDRTRNELHTSAKPPPTISVTLFVRLAGSLTLYTFFVCLSSAAPGHPHWSYLLLVGQVVSAVLAVYSFHRYSVDRRIEQSAIENQRILSRIPAPALLLLISLLPGPVLFFVSAARGAEIVLAFIPSAMAEGVRLLDTAFSVQNLRNRDRNDAAVG